MHFRGSFWRPDLSIYSETTVVLTISKPMKD
jgi:hypothetical protein